MKEAIDLGLDIMDVKKYEVEIEILQQESKGVMGIGRKKAIVKLSLADKNKSSKNLVLASSDNPNNIYESMEQLVDKVLVKSEAVSNDSVSFVVKENSERYQSIEKQLEGKVWVENGEIRVKDSAHQLPLIEIGDHVQLFIDNKLVKDKKTFVTEKDELEVKVKQEEYETKWKISIDKQKLKAMLDVKPGYKIVRKVRDMEPDNQVKLVADESVQVNNTLTYEQVIYKLNEMKITYGINEHEILKALKATENSTYEIAIGKDVEPGLDGWVELHMETDLKDGLVEDNTGKIDFREIKTIPTVEHGKIIATIHPPTPGKHGITVTNESIAPKMGKPISLKAKRGVMLIDQKVVATESGRPSVEQRGQYCEIAVIPKLVHNGNVDLTSGNIHFNGDVEIRGGIEDNMLVEAGGDIVVFEAINQSTLTTMKSIIAYGSVIGSELSAGKNNMLVVELGHLLGIIQVQVDKMIGLINQLMMSPAFNSSNFTHGGLQPLINILLEKKFHGFLKYVKNYVDVVNRGKDYLDDHSWMQVSIALNKLFLTLSTDVDSLDKIVELSKKMKTLHEFSKTPVEPDAFITISNALNSTLYSSGNIIIIGKGSVNTKVHSGGILKVSGIIRGGELYGRLGVDLNEVGTNRGTKTLISVPSNQRIKIKRAMEGTIIKIGGVTYEFQETKDHVDAFLNNDGILILS